MLLSSAIGLYIHFPSTLGGRLKVQKMTETEMPIVIESDVRRNLGLIITIVVRLGNFGVVLRSLMRQSPLADFTNLQLVKL